MKTQFIGIATFKLADTADETSFRETLADTLDYFCAYDGFLRRTISKGKDGWWLDVTEWTSQDASDAADVDFVTDQQNSAFLEHVDRSTLTLRGGNLVVERT